MEHLANFNNADEPSALVVAACQWPVRHASAAWAVWCCPEAIQPISLLLLLLLLMLFFVSLCVLRV
jgi:hypothetical protein